MDTAGKSAMMRAIEDNADQSEIARLLIDYGPADAGVRDADGRVPLHYAAEFADVGLFTRLLDIDPAMIDVDDVDGYTPITMATMSGNIGVINALIDRRSDIVNQTDHEKHSLVHWAVVCCQIDALNVLLARGALASVPDLHGATPLHYATMISCSQPEKGIACLLILLRHCDVDCADFDGRTPLLWAASADASEALISLIQAGADKQATDRDQLTAIHCASSHGHSRIVDVLLQYSPNTTTAIDARDRNGATPLFYAVTFGHLECTQLLLKSNADPNAQDKRLRTASHCAAAKGQLRLLKLLKQFGASFEIQNYRGDLPLHEAVQAGSSEVVEYLLSMHPASLNAANHEGRTALHLSASSGNLELCIALCTRGANINPLMLYKDALWTPLDLAIRKQHDVCVDYLAHRHNATKADQMMSEQTTIESKNRLQQQIAEAHAQHGISMTSTSTDMSEADLRRLSAESRTSAATKKKSRRKSSERDLLRNSRLVQTSHTSIREASTNTATDDGRRRQMPMKSTSTTDLRRRMDDDDDKVVTNETKSGQIPGATDDVLAQVKKKNAPKVEDDEVDNNNSSVMSISQETVIDAKPKYKSKPSKQYLATNDETWLESKEPSSIAADRRHRRAPPTVGLYAHEKTIFEELTQLKKTQIEYGDVQEQALVRDLVGRFCRQHSLNASQFKFYSFAAWEKFLYDQLKLLYLDERTRLMRQRPVASSTRQHDLFARESSRLHANDQRVEQLYRIYGVSQLNKKFGRGMKRCPCLETSPRP